jgi:hypothetical protein
MLKLKLVSVAYHRNGVCGNGFTVCIFKWKDGVKNRRMVATLFEEEGSCAVFDLDELNKENIAFAKGNSWRGDEFEPQLRKMISIKEKENET